MRICDKCIHDKVCLLSKSRANCELFDEKRPHGEWVQTYYSIDGVGASRFKCSKCENEISKYGKPYNFCPSCGADMRKRDGDRNEID